MAHLGWLAALGVAGVVMEQVGRRKDRVWTCFAGVCAQHVALLLVVWLYLGLWPLLLLLVVLGVAWFEVTRSKWPAIRHAWGWDG